MKAIDAIGWVAVALVLLTYAVAPTWFDAANVALCIPVALPALKRGAYPSASISLAFGGIGLVHLLGRL